MHRTGLGEEEENSRSSLSVGSSMTLETPTGGKTVLSIEDRSESQGLNSFLILLLWVFGSQSYDSQAQDVRVPFSAPSRDKQLHYIGQVTQPLLPWVLHQ